jgi:hypothetical protein
MSYEDVSQATPEATTLARADVDSLPAGSTGPASGNAITGAGTITGQAGADSVGDPPGHIVEVHGAGGDSSGSNGEFVVKGAYGTLTIEADGSYTYVRNAGAPDGVDDVFNYTLADKDGHQSSTTLTIELGVQTPAEAVSAALAGVPGVISLPAGVDVSDIHVVGRDLVIDLPDGTHMTIPGGAVFVPQLVIGDVEIPPSNLAALLIDSEPKPAAGPPQSSGGNFAVDVPPLDPGVPLGDLLPPTELVFQPPEFQPVNQFEDREPTVLIETPDNPAGAVNAAESVSEKGLASRGGEPAGSGEIADGNSLNNSDTSETNSGTIVYTAEDGLQSITVNGTAITGVGQVIHGQFGTMTITSIADGAIGYSYTLLDNTSGDNTADNFSVVVTDSDGDTATGTLTVHIADDVPTAHNDADSLTGSDTSTDGNVMTGAGTDSGSSGADVTGADNATVTGAHAGTTGSFTSVPQDGSSVVIHGAFGDLELHEDGSYTYTRTDAHAGGTDTFTYQLTDGDGDTSSATLTISVPQINQAPEVRAADVNVSEEGLVGGNQDSTGNPDTTNLASNGGTLFINDPDGDATTATLGIPSGSFTSGGTPVVWAVSDGGHTLTGTAGGDTVITITIDDSGHFNVALSGAFDDPAANVEDSIGFDVPVQVSDGLATVSTSINVTVEDDSPVVSNVATGAGVTLDETAAGSLAGYPISATSATAAITATTASGADTPASTAYGLSITGQPANLATAIGDHAITLVQIDADTIEGQYTDGSGTHTAFSIDIGSDGKLTVTQDVPLEHLVDGSSASAYNDALDLTGLVNATITVTDADGDTASGSAAIGGNITFLDDGPSIDVAAGADSGIVLETQDAQTAGAASDTATSTANFGGVFTIASSSGGGDGTASISPLAYTLGAADGSDSGLTQTGNTIYLYQLADGSVVGSTAGSEGAVTSGNTVFSVTVDGSGQVTLTQFSQIDHPIADDPSATGAPFADQTITLADGAITLTASATITDNDGDTASDSQTIGIGSNIIFDDDGPSVSNVTGGSSITFDETSAGDITGWPAASVTSAAAMISATVATGADTPASTVYGLELAGGVNSLASGLQTAQGDHAITLVQIDADTIEGQYQDGGTQTAFTIQMNSNGTVTYTQDVPLEHSDDGNTAIAYNDTNSPITFDGLVLGTITVTDYDGDTATGSTNIGDQISIFDDGPTAVAPEAIVTTDEIQPMITASLDLGDHNVVDNFGADGPGTITFANITDGQGTGLTSGGDAITLWLSSDGQTIEGRTNSTDGTDGSLIYTVHIDQANSNYEFTMSGTIDNGSGIVLSDFSSAPAGQNKWIGLDSDGGDIAADNNNSPDLLLTGINGGTVNTSSADIGSNNQWIDNGEGIRIDFVTDVNRNGASTEKTAQGYTFDGHYDVTGTSFSIIQEQGSGSGAAVRIAAYEDSDTGTLQTLSGSPVAIDQSSIVVTGDTTYTIIDMGDGTFVITGLAAGANVSFDTGGADYDAISITNATGQANPNGGTFSGQSFAVGAFGYFTAAAGDPVHLNYDLQVTDSDGDFTTVLGGVDITLNPAGSGTATTTATTLSTFSADATTLSASTLLATNDNSGGQKAGGQQTYSNNAVLFGAVAAAGLMSEQAAASDISHATGHDLGAANETLVSSDSVSQLQLASNDDNNVQSISGETKVAVSDTQQPQDSSHQAADTQPLNLDNSDHGSANAPTDLPQGTDMPAHADSAAAQTVAAATVAMPSAEQIAAAATTAGANGVSGDGHSQVDHAAQHNQVVGKVLADSLAGGGGHESAIDAVLNNLPSHDGAHAVMDALASHGAASVPAWDVGGLGAFAAAHPVFTMEPMMLHPDAAPAAHS